MKMNKKKIAVLALLLVMVVSPFAATFMMSNMMPIHNEGIGTPIKDFGLSANPSVGTAAVCTNPRTTDNLYGGNYETYTIVGNCTDSDDVADIANVTLWFYTTTELMGMRWINSTNSWTEVAGTQAATTFAGTGTNITDANDFNFTLSITFDWTFTDTDNVDLRIQMYATDGNEVNDTADVNYDIDTDLVLTSADLIVYGTHPEGDLMPVNTMVYSYEDSSAAVFPLAAQTDFWVTRSASTTGAVVYDAESWESGEYTESTGTAIFGAITAKGGGEHTETFTIFAVKQGDGSSGTSVMATDGSDTVSIEYGARPGGEDSVIDNLFDGDPTTVFIVAGVAIVGIISIYYFKVGGGAASSYKGGRRKGTRKKTTGKRRPSMKKRRKKK